MSPPPSSLRWSTLTCRFSFKQAYVNGVKVPYTWDNQHGVFRLVNIPQAGTPGSQVCLDLLANSACPTLAEFCAGGSNGMCNYAVFDKTSKCCPTYNLPLLPGK